MDTFNLVKTYEYFLQQHGFSLKSDRQGFALIMTTFVWFDATYSASLLLIGNEDESMLIALGDLGYFVFGGLNASRHIVVIGAIIYRLVGFWFVTYQMFNDFKWMLRAEKIHHSNQDVFRLENVPIKLMIKRKRNIIYTLALVQWIVVGGYLYSNRPATVPLNVHFIFIAAYHSFALALQTYLLGITLSSYYLFTRLIRFFMAQMFGLVMAVSLSRNTPKALQEVIKRYNQLFTLFHQLNVFLAQAYLALAVELLAISFLINLILFSDRGIFIKLILGLILLCITIVLVTITNWSDYPDEALTKASHQLYRHYVIDPIKHAICKFDTRPVLRNVHFSNRLGIILVVTLVYLAIVLAYVVLV